jgi:hypothetical protein
MTLWMYVFTLRDTILKWSQNFLRKHLHVHSLNGSKFFINAYGWWRMMHMCTCNWRYLKHEHVIGSDEVNEGAIDENQDTSLG